MRHHVLKLTTILVLVACTDGDLPPALCDRGIDAARRGDHDQAVQTISQCLQNPGLNDEVKALSLEARAWARSQLKQNALAVEDQEAAFKLKRPTTHGQFINYAFYLRNVGRYQDSLNAVIEAERIEGGQTSMMTQYNKGWSLLQLGRFREAVEAFSLGIPHQSDFAYAYWQRGLAYEGLGDKTNARADFEKSIQLLIEQKNVPEADRFLPTMREKLRQYGLDKSLPL